MKGKELNQFVNEVIKKGPQAILPQNLSDRWLEALLKEADGFDKNDIKDGLAGIMISILTLNDKMNGNKGEIILSPEELFSNIEIFIINLSVEEVSRNTEMKLLNKPTVKDILKKERKVGFENIEELN